jgi:hypothetical protein
MGQYFLGYCMDEYGRYPAPVTLNNPQEVFHYCELQKHFHHEIRIVDPVEDSIVVHVINGLYDFPEEWKRFNKQ